MVVKKKRLTKQLNRFSWTIIGGFICASASMQYHTSSNLYDLLSILPLMFAAVYWCEKSAQLINLPEYELKKAALLNRDLLTLNFSFLLGCLISLCFAYNNSDVNGWWIFIIYFMTLYGFIFSLIFSIFALLIKNHKIYTLIFSFLIIGLISFGNFLPRYVTFSLMGNVETFYIVTGSLLIAHCLFAIIYQIIRVSFNRKPKNVHRDNRFRKRNSKK